MLLMDAITEVTVEKEGESPFNSFLTQGLNQNEGISSKIAIQYFDRIDGEKLQLVVPKTLS